MMNSIIGTIVICSVLVISVVVVAYLYIISELRYSNELAEKRHIALEEWLFKSLYSLSDKVLLPVEANKPISDEPGTVFYPRENEMREYLKGLSEDDN